MLAIASFYEIWQMDVKTAFLNGFIKEELYHIQPFLDDFLEERLYVIQPECFVNPERC